MYEWIILLVAIIALIIVGVRRAADALARALQQRKPVFRQGGWWWSLCGFRKLAENYNELIDNWLRSKKEKDDQLLKIEMALHNIHEGALVLDDTHQVIMVNPAFSRMLHIETPVVGTRLERIMNHGELLNYLKQLEQGKIQGGREIEIVRPGSENLHVEVSGSRFFSSGSEHESLTLLILHDVTRLKKLEKIRRDFVANVSHELRTPLTIIKGYVDTLLDGRESIDTESQARFLEKIGNNTERLNLLLEDLMELSRLESSRVVLRRQAVDPNMLISEIVTEFLEKMNPGHHGVKLELDPALPEVYLDAVKIAQVLGNLLDNAFKYSPERSQVIIRSWQSGEWVHVEVEDNGRGIPSEDLAHIFERFYRVDKGRSRVHGGTGLGLSIVKHILLLHGGQVHARSELGKGTCIRFSLPLAYNVNVSKK